MTSLTARDEERLNWIRQLVEWQKELTDPNEFLSSLKMDPHPDGGLHLHAEKGRWLLCQLTVLLYSPTPSTRRWGIPVSAPKSTDAWCRCELKLRFPDFVEIVT